MEEILNGHVSNNLKTNSELQEVDSSHINEEIHTDIQTIDSKDGNNQPCSTSEENIQPDSSLENAHCQSNVNDEPEDLNVITKKKRCAVIDSDSENEQQLETTPEEQYKEAETYLIDSKGKLILETPETTVTKSKWASLCDSESSEDEAPQENNDPVLNENSECSEGEQIKLPKPKPYKRKGKPKNETVEPKKMTGKDALKLRKQIQSESQRMLRETRISLPYHKPKQFTLQEFLSKRPKLSSAVTLNTKMPPSVAIKMQQEQLEVIVEKFKEREKEVREFYKSDSGSESDYEDTDYIPENGQLDAEKEDNTETIENIETDKTDMSSDQNIDSGIQTQEMQLEQHDNLDTAIPEGCTTTEEAPQVEELETDKNMSDQDFGEKNPQVNESDSRQDVGQHGTFTEQTLQPDTNVDLDSGIGTEEFASIPKNISSCNANSASEDAEIEHILTNPAEHKHSNNINRDSDNYEFNLEDLEESETSKEIVNSNTEFPETHLKDQNNEEKEVSEKAFKNDELDKEIAAFEAESKDGEKQLTISELLKQKLGNIKPRLSGAPDEVVDLETGVTKPKEIVTLIKRFEKHTAKHNVHKNKVHLNVVSVESQGNIEKEVVTINLEDEDSMGVEEKPGVRLKKLRHELQDQIAKRKAELWQNKSIKPEENTGNEEGNENESSKPDYEADIDDILDDEDEEEMSESSEEEYDEDMEEVPTKTKTKSVFIDEEAEDSDMDDDAEEIENIDSDKENIDVAAREFDENSESTNLTEKGSVVETTRKPLKRILKGFTEDSDDEDDVLVPVNNRQTFTDISAEDDDLIPPHQVQNSETPAEGVTQETQNSFGVDFLTPVSFLTGIKNLANSAKKVKESPLRSPLRIPNNPNLPSPLKECDWQTSLHKKLFTDSEIPDSQAIADICSGEFPSTQSLEKPTENRKHNEELAEYQDFDQFPSTVSTTQDLLNICSGKFTGTLQTFSKENGPLPSENIEQTPQISENRNKISELDDVIISQLLDEEEMEKFKKKFDSPGVTVTQKEVDKDVESVTEEVKDSGVIESDDDDEGEGITVKRKKNKSKLTFSDDEVSEDSDIENEEEEIDLHDKDDEDENEEFDNRPVDNIDYDSEENEVEFEDEGEGEGTRKLQLADFIDKEAELSESEWGSADEDEKDLDALEIEEGDEEQFNEKKLRQDLEKIHMRRMLDDDQREVRLLQELLLEDGELHGSGRERQFKWKNIDVVDGEGPAKVEDDNYMDDEESEEHWRKKRYEREMFLKEKQKSLQVDIDGGVLGSSQILKIGQKVLQRSTSCSNSLPNTPDETQEELGVKIVKNSFIFQSKRGSFLARGEQVLQRLADYNKVTDTVVVGATAKNSRKFLFQTVSVEGSSSSTAQDKKRKASDSTPNAIKKLRLSDNFSPATRKKKTRLTSKAKLF